MPWLPPPGVAPVLLALPLHAAASPATQTAVMIDAVIRVRYLNPTSPSLDHSPGM
jgi:hypothetical protein